VEELDGFLPFSHVITKKKMDRQDLLTQSSENDFQLLNYPVSKEYKTRSDNLTLKRVQWKDLAVRNLAFDISYANNFLALKKAYMELLDGTVTLNNTYFDLGNMDPDTFRYKLSLEVSGVNLVKLKRVKIPKAEDTTLFANVRVKGEGINLTKSGDLSGSFNITHIGPELASRFLLALDPEKKDSLISLVRNALEKGAQPELMTLDLKYGQIFSRIWVRETFLYKYILFVFPRLPSSPVEFEPKSLDLVLKSFQKRKK
jgi:hypothetical protein